MFSLPYALCANIIRLPIIYNTVVTLFFLWSSYRGKCRRTVLHTWRNARIRTSLLSLPSPIIVYGFDSIPIGIKISRSLLQLIAREMLRRSAWAMAYRGWTVARCFPSRTTVYVQLIPIAAKITLKFLPSRVGGHGLPLRSMITAYGLHRN